MLGKKGGVYSVCSGGCLCNCMIPFLKRLITSLHKTDFTSAGGRGRPLRPEVVMMRALALLCLCVFEREGGEI